MVCRVLCALFVVSSALLRKVAPEHKAGLAEAGAACVTAASQTNTWTNYCQCFVTNSNKWGSTAGGFSYETEKVEDRYYWNCGAAGGEGFTVCKESTGSLY